MDPIELDEVVNEFISPATLFTLIPVLVAMLLLGLGVGLILKAVGLSMPFYILLMLVSASPIIGRFARTCRRPRRFRRTRPSGVRGSPAGSPSASADDDPPGLPPDLMIRVGAGSWQPRAEQEPEGPASLRKVAP